MNSAEWIKYYRDHVDDHRTERAQHPQEWDFIRSHIMTRAEAVELLRDLGAGTYSGLKFIEAVRMFGGSGWFGNSFCMVSGGGSAMRVWDQKYHDSMPKFAASKKGAPSWAN